MHKVESTLGSLTTCSSVMKDVSTQPLWSDDDIVSTETDDPSRRALVPVCSMKDAPIQQRRKEYTDAYAWIQC